MVGVPLMTLEKILVFMVLFCFLKAILEGFYEEGKIEVRNIGQLTPEVD